MKFLLYGINFAPELTGIGKYTAEMAEWLAAQGHEVRVVTAPPYYPEWHIAPGHSASRWRQERWHGVGVWRSPLWVPVQPTGVKRLIHLASFALSSLFPLMVQIRWRPDVVWVVEPPLICAPAALLLARATGAKAWLHVQDFEVDAAFALGLLKGGWLRRMVQVCESGLMRRFDAVSTISRKMMQRAQNKGVAPQRLVFFPNWVDMGIVTMLPPDAEGPQAYRQQLGITPTEVVALYSGNMGGKQGLEVLADVARLTPSVRFVFCGQGVARQPLEMMCAQLPNVQFLDLQPAGRLGDLLAMADIHLLPQKAGAADLVMPSKLTGMLASGRPVVAASHEGTELASVVNGCGLVVEPENANRMAQAIRVLAVDSAKRHQLGLAGFEFCKNHLSRDMVLQRMVSEMVRV